MLVRYVFFFPRWFTGELSPAAGPFEAQLRELCEKEPWTVERWANLWGGEIFFYRWSWFIYVDFDFAQKQLVGVGFSISDGTMLKGPILYNNLSAAWIITSFMCTGEVDPAMPGSTGITFILLLLTSLVSSSLYKIVVLGDQHQGSCAVGICFNHSIRGGFLDDYLSLLTTGQRVPQLRVHIQILLLTIDFLHWEWHHELFAGV